MVLSLQNYHTVMQLAVLVLTALTFTKAVHAAGVVQLNIRHNAQSPTMVGYVVKTQGTPAHTSLA